MSEVEDRTGSFICDEHFGDLGGLFPVSASDVLKRLRRAKMASHNPKLLIIDVRESSRYKLAHLLMAASMSCYTKTMAKRAIVRWDMTYEACQGCPCPPVPEQDSFCTQLSHIRGTSLLIYNQDGECPFCDKNSSEGYFLDSLVARGNRIYFMHGGLEAFQQLRNAPDFLVCGPTSPAPLTFSPPVIDSPGIVGDSLPDLSRHLLAPILTCTRLSLTAEPVTPSSPPRPSKDTLRPLGSADMSQHFSETSFIHGELRPFGSTEHPVAPKKSRVQMNADSSWDYDEYLDDPDDVLNASVSRILPYLYIGNARDAQNMELLSRLGVTHIINVTDSVPMPFTDCAKFHYLHLPAVDSNEQNLRPAFESAVRFIQEARKSKGIILVHCQAGVSRSVAIVMAFIMHNWRNFNVLRALEFIQTRRPVAGPNLHFMGQLQSYHDDLHRSSLVN